MCERVSPMRVFKSIVQFKFPHTSPSIKKEAEKQTSGLEINTKTALTKTKKIRLNDEE